MNPEFVERRVGSPLFRKLVGFTRFFQWKRLRQTLDSPSWRNFVIAMGALDAALFLALYSGAAAEEGHIFIAGVSALTALVLAGWVALTIVPALARRTPLSWLTYQIDYKVTREGLVYIGGILVVTLAAMNTGNNLLFMVLGCLLAGLLTSGLPSRTVLGDVDVQLELPEHIFPRRAILATVELHNQKQMMPSLSISLVSDVASTGKKYAPANPARQILDRPVYFPYIPHGQTARQNVELTFPRRGVYRDDALGLRTKFPFGFLQKTRRLDSSIEVVVYPQIEPTEEFYEILPL